MNIGEQVEQYLMQELGYSQSGRVILAIRAASRAEQFDTMQFGIIAINSTEIYVVWKNRARSRLYSPYFENDMQTAHLCWWKDGTFEKELSADEFRYRMGRL